MNDNGRDAARLVPRWAVTAGDDLGRGSSRAPWQRTAVVMVLGFVAVAAVVTGIGLVLTHVVAHGTVGGWDEDATAWVADHRVPWLDVVTELLSRSGDTLGAVSIAVVVSVTLWVRHWRWEIVVVVGALALELSVFLVANFVVARPRPSVVRMGSTPSTSSFPSGHAAASLVLWVSIAILVTAATRRVLPRVAAIAMAVVMPLSVGLARVYRGMHHPLDVATGLAMGALVLLVAIVAVSAGRAAAPATDEAGSTTVALPRFEPRELERQEVGA